MDQGDELQLVTGLRVVEDPTLHAHRLRPHTRGTGDRGALLPGQGLCVGLDHGADLGAVGCWERGTRGGGRGQRVTNSVKENSTQSKKGRERFRRQEPGAPGSSRAVGCAETTRVGSIGGIGLKLTDEGLLVGLPREVADVAAAAVGGGGVTDGGPVAAALGGGGLGGRLVLADGDVAIAEGVTWSVTGGV